MCTCIALIRMVNLQNCLDLLRGEQESFTETCSVSSDDGKQFVFVNDNDVIVIKQQEDPEPTTSTAIKNDSVVSCLYVSIVTHIALILTVACLSICCGLVTRFLTLVMKLAQEYCIVCKTRT